MLQQQVQKNSGTKQLGPKEESRYSDSSGVLVLNKKLQDAQKIYEKVKSELSRVKQVLDLFFSIGRKFISKFVNFCAKNNPCIAVRVWGFLCVEI